jgi:hypothetical protein
MLTRSAWSQRPARLRFNSDDAPALLDDRPRRGCPASDFSRDSIWAGVVVKVRRGQLGFKAYCRIGRLGKLKHLTLRQRVWKSTLKIGKQLLIDLKWFSN